MRVAPLAWLPVAAAVAGATQTNLTLFAAPADAGYKFYRIPALLRVLLSAGEAWLLAFAEGRQQGTDHGRVDLVLKRSADDGATWSPLAVVHTESTRERGETIGNPTPLWDEESGEVVLFFCRRNAELLATRSTDAGATWSPPQPLGWSRPAEWTWVAVGPPAALRLRSGRYVLPCDGYAGHARFYQATSVFSFVLYSDDRGATWQQGPLLEGGNECQAAQLPNGSLLLNMRSRDMRRLQAYSDDGGARWSAPAPARPAVRDGNCQGSLLALGDGSVLVATATGAGRASLHAYASTDGGASWRRFASPVAEGGAAYSALVELPRPPGEDDEHEGAGGGQGSQGQGQGGAPSARLGLLYEYRLPAETAADGAKRSAGGGGGATVLRFSTLRVPLRESLPQLPPAPAAPPRAAPQAAGPGGARGGTAAPRDEL